MSVAVETDLDLFSRFCGELVLENGHGMEVEPFQRRMLEDYFAGTQETLVIIGKKNGKTSTIAALALFHLLTTVDAECVIGAASRDQATILFRQAVGLIRRSESIRYRFDVKVREIRSAQDDGRILVLAADAATADGVIPSLAIVDELHRHRSGDLYGVFRDGLGPRNGRLITISTAGADTESPLGIIRARAHQLAEVHREGAAYRYARSNDGGFVMHEWALDASDDLTDISLVKQANPASWHTEKSLKARLDSPSTQPWQWARFACGVWVRGYDQWIPRHIWDECSWDCVAETVADEFGQIPHGSEIVIGLDGSYNNDCTAVVGCTVASANAVPHVAVLGLWAKPPDENDEWTVPVLEVEERIRETCREYKVREIAADPRGWARTLEVLDAERLPVVVFPQSPTRMIEATSRLFTAVNNGGVTHSGDADLARHVENATLKIGTQGGHIYKPTKHSELKIDLAVAAVMAFDRAHHYKRRAAGVYSLGMLGDDMDMDELRAEIAREVEELRREAEEENDEFFGKGSGGEDPDLG